MDGATRQPAFHLLDVAGLVVGYGLASLLVRAYWPDSGSPAVVESLVIVMVFLWLGLAMSGPIVLLVRRPPTAPAEEDGDERPEPRTWAELAWLIIGFYWIGLTILVVPGRMGGTIFLDSAVLGVFPVLAALGLRLVASRKPPQRSTRGALGWTHRAGVGLLLTWPFVWVGLMVLGKTLL
jgi:hypothetical protein